MDTIIKCEECSHKGLCIHEEQFKNLKAEVAKEVAKVVDKAPRQGDKQEIFYAIVTCRHFQNARIYSATVEGKWGGLRK